MLVFSSPRNNQNQIELDQDTEEIILESKQITCIDLSPLARLSRLRKIDLSNNLLKTLDLKPLGSCITLRELNLGNNKLESIDLHPLVSCTELQILQLDQNSFRSIDITPLVLLCKELRRVDLDKLVQKRTILGSGNPMLKTLKEMIGYSMIDFDVPQPLPSLEFVAHVLPQVISVEWKVFHLLYEVLRILDLAWLGMIDTDPHLVRRILETNEGTPKERAIDLLVPLINQNVNEDKTTIGLDVSRLREIGDLAVLTPQIPELRFKELERVRVLRFVSLIDFKQLPNTWERKALEVFFFHFPRPITLDKFEEVKDRIERHLPDYVLETIDSKKLNEMIENPPIEKKVDLEPLFYTAYGYEILMSLGYERFYAIDEFEHVRKAVSEIGVDLRISEDADSVLPTQISNGLREYLLKHR